VDTAANRYCYSATHRDAHATTDGDAESTAYCDSRAADTNANSNAATECQSESSR
jgi:hypothetical protein